MNPTDRPAATIDRPLRPSRRFIDRASTARPRSAATVAEALARQLRPKQWVKNATCLAGLVFSGLLFAPAAEARALAAVAAFCMASSCVYIINDFIDREQDKRNPRTSNRPLAAGELPVAVAAVALGVLTAAALGVSAWLGPACLCVLAAYAAQSVLYCVALKRMVIVDVMCIATGFVLRVLFGVYAVGVLPTPWIILCMFFLALFLGVVGWTQSAPTRQLCSNDWGRTHP